jgi:hypothetical protein
LCPQISTLLISKSFGGGKGKCEKIQDIVSLQNWTLTLNANYGTSYDNITELGMKSKASDGFDSKFDFVTPPESPSGNQVTVYFEKENWDFGLGNKFDRDIRSPFGNNATKSWEFTVSVTDDKESKSLAPATVKPKIASRVSNISASNIVTKKVTGIEKLTQLITSNNNGKGNTLILTWPSIQYTPSKLSFTLTDLKTGTKVDMREKTSYSYTGAENRNFRIDVTDGEIAKLPHSFAFSQYPNPFMTRTTISYAIPKACNVKLNLYDVTGRVVKTLVNGEIKPGYYTMTLEGKDFVSGVYFLRFKAGDEYKSTKKMILVK